MSSLRGRLTAAILAFTGPVIALLVALLYFAVARALWEDLDRGARDTAALLGNLAEWDADDGYELEGGAAVAELLARGPSPAHVAVRGPDGALLRDPLLGDLRIDEGEGEAIDLVVGDRRLRGALLRVTPRTDPGVAAPPAALEVLVLRETAATERTLAALAAWFWALGVISVLVAAGVAALVIHRGLAPLRSLGQALDRIERPGAALGPPSALPDELRPVVDKTEALLARLGDAFARERRFTADVSHELRTPLAVLRVGLDRLADGPGDRRAGELVGEVDRLTSIVERLLLLSRADAGNLPLRVVSLPLGPLVEECWAPLAAAAGARRLRFTLALGDDASVDADEDALRMIVRNVLANAVAYTEVGGWIRVEADAARGVILAVVDSGPPIPAEHLARAFEPFWRADEARRSAGAHCGIGLTLARSLAHVQGLDLVLCTREDRSVAAILVRGLG